MFFLIIENLVQQTPFKLVPLFAGSKFLAFGLLDPSVSETRATLTAKRNSKSISVPFKIRTDTPESGTEIYRLAARSLIRDLEESRSYLHEQKSTHVRKKSNKTKISVYSFYFYR